MGGMVRKESASTISLKGHSAGILYCAAGSPTRLAWATNMLSAVVKTLQRVAFFAAWAAGVVVTTMMSGFSARHLAAREEKRSPWQALPIHIAHVT